MHYAGPCIALLAVLFAGPARSEPLKVGGTGSVTEFLIQLAPVFKAETGIELEVISALGTSGANSALADGRIGVAFSGRDLKDREKARGLAVAVTFRTPFGLATSRPGPDNLKKTEIAALYRADNPRWPDGSPVLITLRPVDESDNIVIGKLFPGMAEALARLRTRREISLAATDQDNAEIAEKNKGSLAGATFTQVVTEKRKLQFVAIDGVRLTMENYRNASYPYGKEIHAVVPVVVSPEARALIAFFTKAPGQDLLKEAGLLIAK